MSVKNVVDCTSCRITLTKLLTCSSSLIEVEGPTTTLPQHLPSFISLLISSAATVHFFSSLDAMTTVAPREASSVAMLRPIPVPPPVTRATLLWKRVGRKTLCHRLSPMVSLILNTGAPEVLNLTISYYE